MIRMRKYPESSGGPGRREQSAVISRFRFDPRGRNAEREEMSSRSAELLTRNDRQIGGIFRKFAWRQCDIVVGNRDEGKICFFGGRHHVGDRPTAVGRPGMH